MTAPTRSEERVRACLDKMHAPMRGKPDLYPSEIQALAREIDAAVEEERRMCEKFIREVAPGMNDTRWREYDDLLNRVADAMIEARAIHRREGEG